MHVLIDFFYLYFIFNDEVSSKIKIGKTFDRRETCIQFRDDFCQINKFMTNINEELKIYQLIQVLSKSCNTRIRSYHLVLTLSFFFTKIDEERCTFFDERKVFEMRQKNDRIYNTSYMNGMKKHNMVSDLSSLSWPFLFLAFATS